MTNEEHTEEVEVEEVETTEEEAEETEAEPEEVETNKSPETPEARYARMKRQTEQLGKKLGITDKAQPEKKSSKSNDLGYDQKAFLIANGIKGAKEFDFVKTELKNSGQDLDSLLENDYFQSRLTNFRELNKTADAIPKGNRSGNVSNDTIEYYMDKPIEEVPADMRIKVVNARLAKDKTKGIFYNS